MENYVAVNTAVGQTERENIKEIVMQGGKWGPLKCSNTMDKIGKKRVERSENLYTYKGRVKVMPLAMVDDLLVMTKCGLYRCKYLCKCRDRNEKAEISCTGQRREVEMSHTPHWKEAHGLPRT